MKATAIWSLYSALSLRFFALSDPDHPGAAQSLYYRCHGHNSSSGSSLPVVVLEGELDQVTGNQSLALLF